MLPKLSTLRKHGDTDAHASIEEDPYIGSSFDHDADDDLDSGPSRIVISGKLKSEGSVFSRYEVMSILGGSANSGVYLCRRKKEKPKVAKKSGLFQKLGLGGADDKTGKNGNGAVGSGEDELFVMKVLRINTVDPTEAEARAAQDFFDCTDKIMEMQHPHMAKVCKRISHLWTLLSLLYGQHPSMQGQHADLSLSLSLSHAQLATPSLLFLLSPFLTPQSFMNTMTDTIRHTAFWST